MKRAAVDEWTSIELLLNVEYLTLFKEIINRN